MMLLNGIHWLSAALFLSLSNAQETVTGSATATPTSNLAAANTFVVTVGRVRLIRSLKSHLVTDYHPGKPSIFA